MNEIESDGTVSNVHFKKLYRIAIPLAIRTKNKIEKLE
jgi:hypothetical protein